MRAVANGILVGLPAVLLSGCSWLGLGNGAGYDNSSYNNSSNRYSQAGSNYGMQAYEGLRGGPCQISSPTQPIPQGCSPEQVTLGMGTSGYGQQAQYTSGGYGSHAGSARTNATYIKPAPMIRRPSLRGTFGLEFDHSVGGQLYDTATAGGAGSYNRAAFTETNVSGVVVGGDLVTTTYSSVAERLDAPQISFDDIYTAPLRVTGGLEYILSDHATVYANAGYTVSEAKDGVGSAVIDTLSRTIRTDTYDAGGALVNTIVNSTGIPNQTVATFNYTFNDMERYDFELGGRYYFDPVLTNEMSRTLTPFVSASGGMAHYNETTVAENQRQLFLQRSFDSGAVTNDFYDVNFGVPTALYDAQWVPYGAIKGGVEWQMTPRTALAFEAGVKYEKQRDFSSGVKGNSNLTVPVAIRGSYNF